MLSGIFAPIFPVVLGGDAGRPVAVGSVAVGVNRVSLNRHPMFLTPVRSIASPTFHLVYGGFKTSVICARFISDSTLVHSIGGAARGLSVYSRRHPITVRVCKGSARTVMKTTQVMRRTRPSVLSVGFKYPMGGITNGNTKTKVLRGVPGVLRVAHTMMSTMGVPIAMGAHLN